MTDRYYYLIEWGTGHDLVIAESSEEALKACFSHQKAKREKDERLLDFDPKELKIKQIQREDYVIKAP